MKKYTITLLTVVLVCIFLTACSQKVNEKKHNVIENPTVSQDTIKIVFPKQFESLSGYAENALVDYLKKKQ